ncbi:TlpA family protein disulfide reductase [Pseudoflavitalea sp. G-6-1-2]|uniref:TlpA family protein disulfide reductase n=1 Tax=Pseudoflavitalea sp. G-6-1-2 TaxID=2728841 RepID=UPI00146ACBB9|nr:TlpA disulfide reductase family protein [Pseudoflavitalea sp. G-6-1-2]NML22246.1 TlpA family protein disulfide reductase [Pseudoflavitalea sp. G-6-1-2]
MKLLRNSLALPLMLCCIALSAQQKSVIRFESDAHADGVKLTLMREWPNRKLMDTALIRDGKHQFNVSDTFPAVYSVNSRKPYLHAIVFMEGADAGVECSHEKLTVKSSAIQQKMNEFLASIKPYEEEWRKIGERYGAAKDMEEKIKIGKEMDAPAEKVMSGREQFVVQHAQDLAGIWMAYEQANLWREPALEKLVSAFRKQPRTQLLANLLEGKLQEFEANRMTGKKAPDFTLADINGNTVSLDSVLQRNQYVLLDVWASWCAPCRATNRRLAPQYDELKKLGIELISISVDEKLPDWHKAVAADKIPWTQLVSAQGMKSKVVADYKVKALPATFLIGKDGTIIRQHIEIDDLKKLVLSR